MKVVSRVASISDKRLRRLKKPFLFSSIFDDFKVESAKYFCILRWQNKHLFLKFGPFDIKKTEEIIHFA